jgi:hypothetical protein
MEKVHQIEADPSKLTATKHASPKESVSTQRSGTLRS